MSHWETYDLTARQQVWNKTYREEEMAKLDQQGRHRSQWIYANYDGRKDGPIPHGAGYQEIPENGKVRNKNNSF